MPEKQPTEIQVGSPPTEFRTALEALKKLQEQGKFQVFLVRENFVRLIGNIDEYRIELSKQLGVELIEPKKVRDRLEEIQSLLQVLLAYGRGASSGAAKMLEAQVYEDEFQQAKEDPAQQNKLRSNLQEKLNAVSEILLSEALFERSKRLSTAVGPLLEDLDVDVVLNRRVFSDGTDLASPFLRVKLRYSTGGEIGFPFTPPPWITTALRDTKSFELECDETDLDVLINRLLQAKEILKQTIDAKFTSSEPRVSA